MRFVIILFHSEVLFRLEEKHKTSSIAQYNSHHRYKPNILAITRHVSPVIAVIAHCSQ